MVEEPCTEVPAHGDGLRPSDRGDDIEVAVVLDVLDESQDADRTGDRAVGISEGAGAEVDGLALPEVWHAVTVRITRNADQAPGPVGRRKRHSWTEGSSSLSPRKQAVRRRVRGV